MPSAKGKPTDPKLKEKVTQEVKQQTNKDGSGKGQMAAWKAAKIGKEYEAKGGDYTNEPGSKDKPLKGPPEKKSEHEKKTEVNPSKERHGDETDDEELAKEEELNSSCGKGGKNTKKPEEGATEDEEEVEQEKPKPKGKGGRPRGSKIAAVGEKKGPRGSSRVKATNGSTADGKRKSEGTEQDDAKKKQKSKK